MPASGPITLTYEITYDDYVQACRARAVRIPARRRYVRWIPGYVLVGVGFVSFGFAPPFNDLGVSVILVALGIFLLVRQTWMDYSSLQRSWDQSERLRHPLTVVIDDEGVAYETVLHSGRLRWAYFVDFVETRDLFVLFSDRTSVAVIVPKRSAESGERRDEIRRVFEQNIQTVRGAFPVEVMSAPIADAGAVAAPDELSRGVRPCKSSPGTARESSRRSRSTDC